MARVSLLKERWKSDVEEGDGPAKAPPEAKRARRSLVPFVAENQYALTNDMEIARAYVTEVMVTSKARNNILMDDRFLRILMCDKFLKLVDDMRDSGVDIDEATTCIMELFKRTYCNPNLGFNEFLHTLQGMTIHEEDLEKRQQVITVSEEDLHKRQQTITLPEENLDERQLAITLPEQDLDKRQVRQQAIIFKDKVKELGQCKYDRFRMILHLYNNYSITIKEAHKMVKSLFIVHSDLVQDFKMLLPDTSIIPSTSVILAIEPHQQPRPLKELRKLMIGFSTIEKEHKVPGKRHGELARLTDKAREGKEKMDIENSKDNMGKRKEKIWEEGSQTKADNCGFEEHHSKKVSQRIADKRQLSFNDGGKAEDKVVGSPELEKVPERAAKKRQSLSNDRSKAHGILHLHSIPKGITNMKQVMSNNSNRAVESPQSKKMPEPIANMKQLSSDNGGRVVGSPHSKKVSSERIVNKRLSPSNNEGKVAGCPQYKRMSTRLKRPTQTFENQNIKVKVTKWPLLPSLKPIATATELVERLNKCMPWRAESVEYNWYNWYKDQE